DDLPCPPVAEPQPAVVPAWRFAEPEAGQEDTGLQSLQSIENRKKAVDLPPAAWITAPAAAHTHAARSATRGIGCQVPSICVMAVTKRWWDIPGGTRRPPPAR